MLSDVQVVFAVIARTFVPKGVVVTVWVAITSISAAWRNAGIALARSVSPTCLAYFGFMELDVFVRQAKNPCPGPTDIQLLRDDT